MEAGKCQFALSNDIACGGRQVTDTNNKKMKREGVALILSGALANGPKYWTIVQRLGWTGKILVVVATYLQNAVQPILRRRHTPA